uniref:DNA-directed RNA polymerase n=1 Tax=Manihot esculenta TaxID=3983 RepID=A0A2C9UBB0_MANES
MKESMDDMEEDMGTSSKGEKLPNEFDMEIDFDGDDDEDDGEFMDLTSLGDLGEGFLEDFCKKAATLFFNEYGLISHQINSYNDFIHNGLQMAFDSFDDLVVEPGYDPSKKGENEWRYASVRFGKVTVDRPSFWAGSDGGEHNMFPRHARLQNMTYSARMKVNVTVEVYTQKVVSSDEFRTGKDHFVDKVVLSTDSRDIIIGRMPVMVKSDLCWMQTVEKGDCDFDHGGYFLIKGAEKVLIAQEQSCLKRLWISNTQGWTVAYKSEVKRNRLIVRLEPVGPSKDENLKEGKKGLTVYFLSTEIPLWILFFALGIKSDKEVIDLIDYNMEDASIMNIIFGSIHDADDKCEGFRKERNALDYLVKQIQGTKFPPGEDEDCISLYLFPTLHSPRQKARFLGYMVKCLLQAYSGKRKCDNRDSFRNKRFELAAELLDRELKVHIAHARRRMSKVLQKDLYGDRDVRPIEHYLDASIVTNGLSRAFSSGAWSHPFKRMERISGVVANLGRTNPLQTMVDLRKTRQQVLYTGKVGGARYPHPSHWGRVCFLSTPDGENCGLVKNLAATGLVSTNISEPLIDILFDCGMEKIVDDAHTKLNGKHIVFLNGEWVGVCEDSHLFVTELRRLRRRKRLPQQVEIKRDDQQREIRIFSDAGRILRPLLVVENLTKIKAFKGGNYTFQSLLDKGIIEFVGTEEEEDCNTAWSVKLLLAGADGKQPVQYTHCELDMSFLLGLSCGIIPFANHDHARRVLYQAQKHCQQAIGFYTTNPNIRVDTVSHQLHYPQRPLFRTVTSDCLGKSRHQRGYNGMLPKPELYNGQNAIVAVNVHLGYNQEDSLVMNRSSLERGLFRSEHSRSYKADVDNKELLDKWRKFDDTINFGKVQSKFGRVDSLDDDGFPFIGANLQSGDIVIGRCAESGADHSIKLKHTERGMVQKVVLSSNDEGKNFAVVSLRQVHV